MVFADREPVLSPPECVRRVGPRGCGVKQDIQKIKSLSKSGGNEP